jgi:hypothetical protein
MNREQLKNGLKALEPISIGIVIGGALILACTGFSFSNFTPLKVTGMALVAVGSATAVVDYGYVNFL